MNYSFEYIDIILLGMIAGFIFLRLRGILGKRTSFHEKLSTDFEQEFKSRDIPKEFFAAAERGVMDSVIGGAMAGYPFIGIKAKLLDMKFDELDSNEVAYTIAASMAFPPFLNISIPDRVAAGWEVETIPLLE